MVRVVFLCKVFASEKGCFCLCPVGEWRDHGSPEGGWPAVIATAG